MVVFKASLNKAGFIPAFLLYHGQSVGASGTNFTSAKLECLAVPTTRRDYETRATVDCKC